MSKLKNDFLNPNPVAAMPSLHAAYPWLSFLALRKYSKKLGWFFLPYPILVWFSVVYLGEHYVIDVIAGVVYAQASFWIVNNFDKVKSFFFSLLPKVFKPLSFLTDQEIFAILSFLSISANLYKERR